MSILLLHYNIKIDICLNPNSGFMNVTLHDITFGYTPDIQIFNKLCVHFESKKTHIILGKSGSGKSTLLKLIAGELIPSAGHIGSDGHEWISMKDNPIPGFRQVAFLNQEFDLHPYCSVKENLRKNLRGFNPEEEEMIIRDVSDKLDISDLHERRAIDLSGGQKQRVAFASILASRPQVLLMDEPLSNQDFRNAQNIKDIIQWLRGHKTLIIATHDMNEALSLGDTISILQGGQVIQKGPAKLVYENPVNEYSAGLLGHYNLIPVDWLKKNFPKQKNWTNFSEIILRPHAFTLNRTHGLMCKVLRTEYSGMYHMILVEADGILLYVYYPHSSFDPRDRWKIDLVG